MTPTAVSTSTAFQEFRLGPLVQRGITAIGFKTPRPIQTDTIPAVLQGRDVLGLAQTGTGKTAAFALPILERLITDRRRGIRALIVAPTRELAMQITTEIRSLAKFTRLKTLPVYGGVSIRPQKEVLARHPDIVVACPGRLLDLLGQRALTLDHIQTLVLDEADHLFDMGFLPDIRRILSALPKKRQNLLFSATMPAEVRGLADNLLRNPHVVDSTGPAPAPTIAHVLYPVARDRKYDLLYHLLSKRSIKTAIIFTRTKHRARQLGQVLVKGGYKAVALQGNMTQAQRDRAMNGFREGRFRILVATDLAARGIDVLRVSHVINFDIPNTPVAYTHRIGRTGRSERRGQAYTFVCSEDREMVRSIEAMIGSRIPRETIRGFGSDSRPGGRPVRKPRSQGHRPKKHANGWKRRSRRRRA